MKEVLAVERIERTIFFLRGQKVILDADLAKLYGVTTKRFNQQVRRNSERFPEDFMFKLTKDEKNEVVANCNHLAGLKFSPALPSAFTEHGVIMAASVLNTQYAINVSIFVVRAFVRLRRTLATHKELARKLLELEDHLKGHDQQIHTIFEAIHQLMAPPEKPKKKIGYTVKEKQKHFGKSAAEPIDGFDLTPQARAIWDAIPGNIQLQLLNNVWCGNCRKTTGIGGSVSGKVEKGMLVLYGSCTSCGGEIVRTSENE